MRKQPLSLLVCLLGAAVLGLAPVRAQQDDACARSAPAGSLVYVSVDTQNVQQFWEQIKNSSLVTMIQQARGGAKPAGGGDQGTQMFLKMLNQAFTGRVSIALADEALAPKQVPSVVAVLPIKGRDEANGLISLLKIQLQMKKIQLATRDYQGVTITTASGPGIKGVEPSYALLDDRLLIATKPGWLEKAIDATAGRAPALAAAAGFERVRARVAAAGPATGWFWMDVARFNERFLAIAEQVAPGVGANKPDAGPLESAPASKGKMPNLDALKAMMGAYQGAGGRLVLTPQGVTVEGLALIDPNHPFGQKLLAMKGGPLRGAALTSSNAILFAGMNNLPFYIDLYAGILASLGPDVQKGLDGFGQAFTAATGLDARKDLLDNLGNEMAVVLNDIPADLKSIPLMIYVQTKDRAALGKALQTVRARLAATQKIQFVQKDLPQGRLYYMDTKGAPIPIAPGWTFAGDFLVIGTSPDALRSPLFLAAGTGASLAASPAYQQVLTGAGDHLVSAFYVNLAKVAALADKLPIPPAKNGPDAAMLKKVLGTMQTASAISTVEQDAVAFRANLAVDLTK